MTVLTKTLMAVGISAVLAGAAFAQGRPLVLKADEGYVVDKNGKAMIMSLSGLKKEDMAKAKAVPKGTMFFMHDGTLMMMESIDR
ncbi:MAG: hypothetical protein ACR2K5_10390 [Pseudolabrys sp.]